jgi:hypothetical protein
VAAERWDEQVGSVADEAARLLESLRRSAAETADAAAAAGAADTPGDTPPRATAPGGDDHVHAAPSPGAEHDPVCQWCPICRGAAVVRALSPETLTRLADLASLAAGMLAELAVARGTATASGSPSDDQPATPRQPVPAASRPIAVHDADEAPEGHRG